MKPRREGIVRQETVQKIQGEEKKNKDDSSLLCEQFDSPWIIFVESSCEMSPLLDHLVHSEALFTCVRQLFSAKKQFSRYSFAIQNRLQFNLGANQN